MAEAGGLAGLVGMHHVALSVRDVAAASAWYQGVLGLREEVRMEDEAKRSVILRLPGTDQQVGLVEHREQAGGFDARRLGLDHLAFAVRSRDELVAFVDRLEGLDAGSSGVLDTPFGAMVHFRDLDGIALALFWNR